MVFQYNDKQLNELMEQDEVLKKFILKTGKAEYIINEDLFEAIVCVIVYQHIPQALAKQCMIKLRNIAGKITPERIIELSDAKIRKCGITFRKTAFIKRMAVSVLEKEIDLDEIRNMDDQDAINAFSKLPGIGEWTAEILLIFSLNRMNIFPRKDKHLINGLKKLYQCEIDESFLDECQKRFSPYCSLASLYLWKAANDEMH